MNSIKWILEFPAAIIRFFMPAGIFLLKKLGNLLWFLFAPVFRKIGPWVEKRPGAVFSIFGIAVSFFLFVTGVLSGFESSLTSLIYQLGYREKMSQNGIWIVKKDEKTSGLIGKPISRRDYASILRQIGRSQTFKNANLDGSNEVKELRFLEMKIGLIKNGEKGLISLPLIYGDQEEMNPSGTGPFSIAEDFKRLFHQFFEFPEISSGTLSDFEKKKEASITPDLMMKTTKFFQILLKSFVSVTIKILPKPNVIFQISFQMNFDRSSYFEIPPAGVIGWDILLQGSREPEEDNLLEHALKEIEAPIVLAGQCENEVQKNVSTFDGKGESLQARLETIRETSLLVPIEKFMQPRTSLGIINVNADSKNFITSMPLFSFVTNPDRILPGFSLLVAVKALDKKNPGRKESFSQAMENEFKRILSLLKSGTFKGGFQLADRFIPTDKFGNMSLYFLGSTDSGITKKPIFKGFSGYEAFDDQGILFYQSQGLERTSRLTRESASEFCRMEENYGDRIILVGTFEKSDFDFYPTPMTVNSPFRLQDRQLMGIEIHANAVANILDQRYLKPPVEIFSIILMVSTTLLLGLLSDYLSILAGCLLGLLFLGGILSYSYFLFHQMAQIFHVSLFFFSYTLTSGMTATVKGILESHWAAAIRPVFKRFVDDINMARQVQEKLFPVAVLEVGDYRVFGISQPATELGGDYFDYLAFGDQEMLVLLGDVSGHGIASALVMAMSKALVANFTKLKAPPKELFGNLNHAILETMKFSALMPMVALYIDAKTNSVQLFSYGHPLPYKIDTEGKVVELECKTSRPLGSMKVFPAPRPNVLELAPGERFLFYTDGLVESLDIGEEKTGFKFFQDYLQTCPRLPLEQACHEILKNHPFFKTEKPQPDDFTIVIVERKAPSSTPAPVSATAPA